MAGFVDLQVNGYAGVDFNSDQFTRDQLVDACRRLAADGNESVLATVITAPLEQMVRRTARLVDLIETDPEIASTIGGIHLEGPFISPIEGFVGAHPRAAVTPATTELAKRLVDAGRGLVRLMTLAPEMDTEGRVTQWLDGAGITVAAGHTDASIDQLHCAIDNGLRLFTHLGNGCPSILHRHDNIIQRVLSLSDRLMISFIADGHHVPDFALRNYFSCVPDANIVIVTDAISAAGLGPGRYELAGQTVEVDPDGAAWAACRTHYAGCATTFPQMECILRGRVGASDQQIDQWMRINPVKLLQRS